MGQDDSKKSNHSDSSQSSSNPSSTQVRIPEHMDMVSYVVKKTEKIAQALYVLTSHLSPDEPFRKNIRDKSLRLVDDLYAIKTDSNVRSIMLNQIVNYRFAELLSILNIGARAGLVSDMNLSVIASEIDKLQALVKDNDISIDSDQNYQLESNFFDAPESVPAESPSLTISSNNSPSLKRHKYVDPDQSRELSDTSTKSINQPPTTSSTNTTDSSRSKRRHGRNHSKRQRAILGLFRDKDEITINDVQAVIEGCSQKTMQRELKNMVEGGLLEKRGKRRWSSYTLETGIDIEEELANF